MLTRRILAAILLIGVLIVLGVVWHGSNGRSDEVVVYVSHDQVFSEPILKDFERDTGIHVRAMFDTEETKSAGLMNRLLAEKDRPQADVYWANEPIRADVLRQRGVAAPYRSASAEGIPAQFRDPNDYWTGFSARARMLILDRRLEHKPASIRAYTDRQFRGRAVIANPLFGTTTAHIAALFTVWGDAQAKAFLQAIRANGVRVASSNGDSADQVAKGAAQFALVDNDDVFSRQKEGQPIEGAYPDQEPAGLGCFIVPNALVLIKGAPHAEAGRKLIDYLLAPDTERKLAFSDAAQIPLHSGVETPPHVPHLDKLRVMTVDYGAVAAKLQQIQPWLSDWARN
jgi:iron(III) transport system substrate-binding protein